MGRVRFRYGEYKVWSSTGTSFFAHCSARASASSSSVTTLTARSRSGASERAYAMPCNVPLFRLPTSTTTVWVWRRGRQPSVTLISSRTPS